MVDVRSEKERLYHQKYYKENKEAIIENHRKYNCENGEKIRERKRRYNHKHPKIIHAQTGDPQAEEGEVMTKKEKEFAADWVLIWQTECAGGTTRDFLCEKKRTHCNKEQKLICQNAMKKIMKSLGYGIK